MSQVCPSNHICLRALSYVHFDHKQYAQFRQGDDGAQKFLEPYYKCFEKFVLTDKEKTFEINTKKLSGIIAKYENDTYPMTISGEPDIVKRLKVALYLMIEMFLDQTKESKTKGTVDSWNHMFHLLEPFRSVLDGIRKSEFLEYTKAIDGQKSNVDLANLRTKYMTTRIDAVYYLMGVVFPIYEELDIAFRYSDSFRKTMFTEGGMFFDEDWMSKREVGEKNKPKYKREVHRISFSDIRKLEKNPKPVRHKDIRPEITVEQFIEAALQATCNYVTDVFKLGGRNFFIFNGVGMVIPQKAKTVLSLTKPYPTAIIRGKMKLDDKEQDNSRLFDQSWQRAVADSDYMSFEVHMEENPWSFTYIVNWPNLLEIDGIPIHPVDQSVHRVADINLSKILTEDRLKKFAVDFPEDPKSCKNDAKKVQSDYLSVKAVIHRAIEDDDIEIIIQLPYLPPRADLLTNIYFNDLGAPDIILSCS